MFDWEMSKQQNCSACTAEDEQFHQAGPLRWDRQCDLSAWRGHGLRLPRIEGATGQVDKEHQWLQKLAPHLPLAIPDPLAKGTPGEGYPWQWSIYRWLKGETAI